MVFFLTNPGIVFRKLWLVALRRYRALAALGSNAVVGESIRESPAVRFVSCARVHHTQQRKIPGTASATDTPLSELFLLLCYLCLEPRVSGTVGGGGGSNIQLNLEEPNTKQIPTCRVQVLHREHPQLCTVCSPVAGLSHLILKGCWV